MGNASSGAVVVWHEDASLETYVAFTTGTLWTMPVAPCPSGWHVPTDGEWTVLIDHLVARLWLVAR